nr:MAG TPA: hypothetical protein [Caudoviricetes sp.]
MQLELQAGFSLEFRRLEQPPASRPMQPMPGCASHAAEQLWRRRVGVHPELLAGRS